MLELDYSVAIEATADPNYFGFYSPDLKGFTGIGHSIEDCIYQAQWGMKEHVETLIEHGLPVPLRNPKALVVISNETDEETIESELLHAKK
jgi:predicted RNase H-like HicB family nuclease